MPSIAPSTIHYMGGIPVHIGCNRFFLKLIIFNLDLHKDFGIFCYLGGLVAGDDVIT